MADYASTSTKDPAHKWTEEETRQFLALRLKYDYKFKIGKRGAARDGFTFILKEMELNDVTHEQARKKYNNMVQKYKDLKHPPTGTGMECDEECTPISWPFFEDMDRILGERPIISPPCLVSSLEDFSEPEAAVGENTTDHGSAACPEPPKKKNKRDQLINLISEQNERMREQEDKLYDQNQVFLSLFDRLVTAVEAKEK